MNELPAGADILMPYGPYDFTPGANFFFVILPR